MNWENWYYYILYTYILLYLSSCSKKLFMSNKTYIQKSFVAYIYSLVSCVFFALGSIATIGATDLVPSWPNLVMSILGDGPARCAGEALPAKFLGFFGVKKHEICNIELQCLWTRTEKMYFCISDWKWASNPMLDCQTIAGFAIFVYSPWK